MNIERLEDIDNRLFSKNDSNGEIMYFYDPQCQQPFNGIIYGMCGNPPRLDYECEIQNGVKDGLELVYNEEGGVEQASECRHNLMYGVSKEYDEDGSLLTVSVVLNNSHLKIIEIEDNQPVTVREYEAEFSKNRIPEDIQQLLNLTDEALINYKFKPLYNKIIK